MAAFTFLPEIIVAGRSKSDNKVVYIAKDAPSGGYWYWTSEIDTALRFSEDQLQMISASRNTSILLHAVDEAYVLVINRQVEQEIPVGSLPEIISNKRLAELKDKQRQIEQEISELEG